MPLDSTGAGQYIRVEGMLTAAARLRWSSPSMAVVGVADMMKVFTAGRHDFTLARSVACMRNKSFHDATAL